VLPSFEDLLSSFEIVTVFSSSKQNITHVIKQLNDITRSSECSFQLARKSMQILSLS
jgi:hypothetical protein